MVSGVTFLTQWSHRNGMSEFMGLVRGVYDATSKGFEPGGRSLHNCVSAHGPEAAVFEKASSAELEPDRYTDTLAFMFETRYPLRPTRFALDSPRLQRDYLDCWRGIARHFDSRRP